MTSSAESRLASWRRVGVVLGKELLDHGRDYRSLLLALIYPCLVPLALGLMLHLAAGTFGQPAPTPASTVRIGVIGAEHAPSLTQALISHGLRLVRLEGEAVRALRAGYVQAVIELEPLPENPARLAVRLEATLERESGAHAAELVKSALQDWGREQVAAELARHGLDPGLAEPVTLTTVDLGREIGIGPFFYRLIAPVMIFLVFLGALYLTIDSTVGERERGSWEPLLTAPLARSELLLGKALAAGLATVVTVAINLATFWGVLVLVSTLHAAVAPPPPPAVFLQLMALALPLIALGVAVQLALTALARSAKEAQIYLGLLPLLPATPALMTSLSPAGPDSWQGAMPLLGQIQVSTALLQGLPPAPGPALLCAGLTLLLAGLVFRLAVWLYGREALALPAA